MKISYGCLKWSMVMCIFTVIYSGNVIADPDDEKKARLVYEVKASNASLQRRVTGPIVASVNGVAAEPVDSFVWDGNGSVPIKGWAKLKIDPVANTGKIMAQWEDENGHWTYKQTMFVAPGHPTGARIGSSLSSTILEVGDSVMTNVYLHGDTTAGGPVMPTQLNLLTTWGPAEVTLNGESFDNPYDGPLPLWAGHTMTAVGARGEDRTIRTESGGIFSIMKKSEGVVDNDDLEFHLVFHDAPGPLTGNVPPPLSFFYHLTFEDVKISIKHND
ncbi:hypothetical protein MNBD_GAMMA25-1057 [hydrothermal vent metagenome]|uniref:Uncharacterized protein n=1 Tax=hydrothermal vent metagenome TaxID=652676 RepID=A0A3B1AIA0_9ZZZZ